MKKVKCKTIEGRYALIPREKLVFRPSVYALIKNKDKVLLMRNKSSGKLWPPGGGVEIGESMYESLKREVLEETGLKIDIGKLLFAEENFFYYSPLDEAYHAFVMIFDCKIKSGKLLTDEQVDDYESEKPRWIDIKSLKTSDFQDFQKEFLAILNTRRETG